MDRIRPWLPNWFYESLPYLNVGLGLLAYAWLENDLGALSGGILAGAGITCWTVRMMKRRTASIRTYASNKGVSRAIRATEAKSYYNDAGG